MTEKNSFGEAIETLRSNGYSSMALFLESQILRFSNGQSTMTVFAPSDDTLAARIDDFTDYPSLYCRILWNDLMDLEKGTKLSTYSKGFAISVAKSNGILMINGVAVIYPNMYVNDWLLVHGLLDVFSMAERLSAKESGSEMRNITHGLALDHWNLERDEPKSSIKIRSSESQQSNNYKIIIGLLYHKEVRARVEVIQPHLPVRLPSYDFTPVTS
ncbi:putative fasciclin-like arabinogalactan protein 20, partial [Cucurbita argyrosperma subsp. argyrosperma]